MRELSGKKGHRGQEEEEGQRVVREGVTARGQARDTGQVTRGKHRHRTGEWKGHRHGTGERAYETSHSEGHHGKSSEATETGGGGGKTATYQGRATGESESTNPSETVM